MLRSVSSWPATHKIYLTWHLSCLGMCFLRLISSRPGATLSLARSRSLVLFLPPPPTFPYLFLPGAAISTSGVIGRLFGRLLTLANCTSSAFLSAMPYDSLFACKVYDAAPGGRPTPRRGIVGGEGESCHLLRDFRVRRMEAKGLPLDRPQ